MSHPWLTGGRPPRTQTISTADLVALIDGLGCTRERLAEILGVTSRTIRLWAAGSQYPPKGVVLLLRLFEARRQARADTPGS